MGGWTIVRFRAAYLLCGFFGVSVLVGAARWAATQVPPLPLPRLLAPNEGQQQLELWQKEYQDILADLHGGKRSSDKRARKHAFALYEDVVDRAVSGEVLCQIAGRVLTLLAIAETRLGDRNAGAWHWQMAQNVSAELRGVEFADFPDVAPFLKASLIPETRWEELRQHVTTKSAEGAQEERQNLVSPRLKKKVPPRYPAGLKGQLIEGKTIIHAIIDEEGRVREPVVQRGCGHVSLDLAAMEALREWKYAPATRDGMPFAVRLNVTVSFRTVY